MTVMRSASPRGIVKQGESYGKEEVRPIVGCSLNNEEDSFEGVAQTYPQHG